jgi:serine/threonine protein kinase
MSPEQLSAAAVDARSDLWSLGCVLYELLTGSAPFERETLQASCAAVLELEPAALSTLRPELAPGLSALVARCLRKDPAERYPDAAQLAAALVEYGTGRFADYPARCCAQLRGDRRSAPQLPAPEDEPAPPLSMSTLRSGASVREAVLILGQLRARIHAAPRRSLWLAIAMLSALWVLSWVQVQRAEEPHIVTPSAPTRPRNPNGNVRSSDVDALPAGAEVALEQGKAEPKILQPNGKRRRHLTRGGRYQRRHAQPDPDVGF